MRRKIVLGTAIAGFIALLAVGFVRAVISARQEAIACSCNCHLKQLGLALHTYHEIHQSFPPAYVVDATGRPLYSWRVLLLPFIDQGALYERFRLDEPWDSPNNRPLGEFMPEIYRCPADSSAEKTMTNYLAVVGEHAAWHGATPVTKAELPKDSSSRIMLVEVASSGVHWMEPRDMALAEAALGVNRSVGKGIRSHHPSGATFLFADASVSTLPDSIPTAELEVLLRTDTGSRENNRSEKE